MPYIHHTFLPLDSEYVCYNYSEGHPLIKSSFLRMKLYIFLLYSCHLTNLSRVIIWQIYQAEDCSCEFKNISLNSALHSAYFLTYSLRCFVMVMYFLFHYCFCFSCFFRICFILVFPFKSWNSGFFGYFSLVSIIWVLYFFCKLLLHSTHNHHYFLNTHSVAYACCC